ncbi:MAG: prepilin-type N-terminal cleavage/methylation domain-containing protein [Candidatus Sumerlaeia bacterium]|nr:prepilin-type N-terminal cleavage/methylation domain-containing protein [Candidatus Sumerlaeia bacterium]
MRGKSAFTLIELLIVVAIIAILAAIAVPNFLEAQVRSKVSRAKADMRTITTALESYYVDNNRYPAPHEAHNQAPWSQAYSEPPFHARVPSMLTTPIAYLSSIPDDAFRTTRIPGNIVNDPYLQYVKRRNAYFNWAYMREIFPTVFANANSTFSVAEELSGAWLIYSPGPNADEFNRLSDNDPLVAARVYIDYDPTNGTVSQGNIFRTAKSGERLGSHPLFQ